MSDHFEQELSRRPMREIPAEWRREILRAANGGDPVAAESRRRGQMGWLDWVPWRGAAWGGLAAAWVLILGLNWAANRPGAMGSAESLYSPQVMAMAWQQSQRLVIGMEANQLPSPRGSGTIRPRSATTAGQAVV